MKQTSATTDSTGLHARVQGIGAHNVAALAELLEQGNGVYVVTVHKGRVVKYARVERPVQVLPADGTGGHA